MNSAVILTVNIIPDCSAGIACYEGFKTSILFIHSSTDSVSQRNESSLHSKFAKTLSTQHSETMVI